MTNVLYHTDGGVVLLSSNEAETRYKERLEQAGFQTETYLSATACALSLMDSELFEELKPGVLRGRPIVGAVMHKAKPSDVIALSAIGDQLGYFSRTVKSRVHDIEGNKRGFDREQVNVVFTHTTTGHGKLIHTLGKAVPYPPKKS